MYSQNLISDLINVRNLTNFFDKLMKNFNSENLNIDSDEKEQLKEVNCLKNEHNIETFRLFRF